MLVARNRLGYEGDTAGEIRDDQRPVAGRPVFPGPQLALACPGPAWPQGAIYQRDRAPGSLCRLVHGRPELRGRLIDQWRQEANVSRDRGLIHVEDLCPDFLNDVIAGVSAGNDDCFTQGKFPRVAFSPNTLNLELRLCKMRACRERGSWPVTARAAWRTGFRSGCWRGRSRAGWSMR